MAFLDINGPFKGAEEFEWRQTPQHADLALNVSFAKGRVQSRDGHRLLVRPTGADARVLGLYFHRPDNAPPRILAVTSPRWTGNTEVHIISPTNGVAVTVDLTATFGEPVDYERPWGFAEIYDRVYFSNGRGNLYRYDANENPATVFRQTAQAGVNSANIFYATSPPAGNILIEHQGALVVSGFVAPYYRVPLNGTLVSGQDLLDENAVADGRAALDFSPRQVVFSDPGRPNEWQSIGFLTVEQGEPVTGLASLDNNLVIFTPSSIWVAYGPLLKLTALKRVVDGIGCVAHRTIAQVGNVLMFCGRDGIYSFDGAAVEKVSGGLERTFNGDGVLTVPSGNVQTIAETAGWPFVVDKPRLRWACAAHDPERHLYLCAVKAVGDTDPNGLILAYDYEAGAWAVWHGHRVSGDFYVGAFAVDRGAVESVVYFGSLRRGGVYQRGRGRGAVSDSDQDVTRAIGMVYVSPRHMLGDERLTSFKHLRVRHEARARTDATNPPRWALEAENAAFDVALATDTAIQRQQGTLAAHPNQADLYFWGQFTWGAAPGGTGIAYTRRDIFSERVDTNLTDGRVTWMRAAFAEDNPNGNTLSMQGYTLEADKEETAF